MLTEALAIHGGPRAIEGFAGRSEPKIGVEELLELVDLWTTDPQTKDQIRQLVVDSGPRAPHLFRYYNEHSKVVAF